ncbi:MAG: phytoene/squalene synthase family protein [Deinococcota bacterium]|nr:phytoene/squalene synthase family protein [Deinococcota bacterium]
MRLEQALLICSDITRHHSSTFYLGSGMFPKAQRRAVHVIYAVCRGGDDAVDEAPSRDEAARRLEAWWQGIERAYKGAPRPENETEVALSWVLERHDVPYEAFAELHLGFCSDLSPQPVRDLDELMLYCRRVAGVVGLLIAPIAGYRGGEATLRAALSLGQAMQLTNILRDVGEDLSSGRCYLPADLLRKHRVDLAELQEGRVSEGYIALVEELSEVARSLYRQGWQGIPKLSCPASTAVGVAALNYEAILEKLRRNNYNNLTERAHLRPIERIILIPRAVYGVYSRGVA